MRSKEKGRSGSLKNDAVNRLFERFSLPLVQPCITPSQKRNAVEIAKMLWLRFVTGTDSEENVYDDLKRVLSRGSTPAISG